MIKSIANVIKSSDFSLQMRKLGFQILDALEPSQGMLDVAKEKGLYRKYICEAIGKEQLDLPAGSNKY